MSRLICSSGALISESNGQVVLFDADLAVVDVHRGARESSVPRRTAFALNSV